MGTSRPPTADRSRPDLDPRTWDLPGRSKRSGLRRTLPWVGVAAAAVGALVVATLVLVPSLWFGSPPARCNPAVPSYFSDQLVLVACGTTEPIGADHYWVIGIPRMSDDQSLYGLYAGSASLGAYLLNGSQVLELLANPHPSAPPPASFWSCTTGASCAVNVEIPPSPGQYSLALENLGPTNASVRWSESLLLAYTPSLPAIA